MTRQTVEDAVERFHNALEALQLAIERRKASEDQLAGLEEDLHLMAVDRAQLARKLDEALADTQKSELQAAVAERIDRTIGHVDALIALAEAA